MLGVTGWEFLQVDIIAVVCIFVELDTCICIIPGCVGVLAELCVDAVGVGSFVCDEAIPGIVLALKYVLLPQFTLQMSVVQHWTRQDSPRTRTKMFWSSTKNTRCFFPRSRTKSFN